MKISWNSLKISIAGAKLSHLVQKDKIWDHGSMTEQAKNIFYQVERARHKKDSEMIKNYVTPVSFGKLKEEIEILNKSKSFLKNSVLTEIFITEVSTQKKQRPDCFKALIKGKRKNDHTPASAAIENFGIENFSEEWFFVRQGDWWLLDKIKTGKHFFHIKGFLLTLFP